MQRYLALDRSTPGWAAALGVAVRAATAGELDQEHERIAADVVVLCRREPGRGLEHVVRLAHRCPHGVTAEVRTAALIAWAEADPALTGADWAGLSAALGERTCLDTLLELVESGRCTPASWFGSTVEELSAGAAHPGAVLARLHALVLAAQARRLAGAGELDRACTAAAQACELVKDPAMELLRRALELTADPARDLRAELPAGTGGADPLLGTWSALATWCAGDPARAATDLRDLLLGARGAAPKPLRSASRMLLAALDGDGVRVVAAARAALARDGDGWARDLPVAADTVLVAVAERDEDLLRRLLAGLDLATLRLDVRTHAAEVVLAAALRTGRTDAAHRQRLAMARTLLEAS